MVLSPRGDGFILDDPLVMKRFSETYVVTSVFPFQYPYICSFGPFSAIHNHDAVNSKSSHACIIVSRIQPTGIFLKISTSLSMNDDYVKRKSSKSIPVQLCVGVFELEFSIMLETSLGKPNNVAGTLVGLLLWPGQSNALGGYSFTCRYVYE